MRQIPAENQVLRGAGGIAGGDTPALSGTDEAIALARAGAPDMVRTLIEISRGSGSKPGSPYVRARAAACVLEVCGLVKAGPTAEVPTPGDAS